MIQVYATFEIKIHPQNLCKEVSLFYLGQLCNRDHCNGVCSCKVSLVASYSCDPTDCSTPGSFVHGDSPGKNTGMGCHALLQGIFPTQGLNPGFLHCRQILYHLSPRQNRSPPNCTTINCNMYKQKSCAN